MSLNQSTCKGRRKFSGTCGRYKSKPRRFSVRYQDPLSSVPSGRSAILPAPSRLLWLLQSFHPLCPLSTLFSTLSLSHFCHTGCVPSSSPSKSSTELYQPTWRTFASGAHTLINSTMTLLQKHNFYFIFTSYLYVQLPTCAVEVCVCT